MDEMQARIDALIAARLGPRPSQPPVSSQPSSPALARFPSPDKAIHTAEIGINHCRPDVRAMLVKPETLEEVRFSSFYISFLLRFVHELTY